MKKSCYHKCCIVVVLFIAIVVSPANAQLDTLFIDSSFSSTNLKPFSSINSNLENNQADKRSFFYFSFNNTFNTVDFTITNTSNKSQVLLLELSNIFIKEIDLRKKDDHSFSLLFRTGTDYFIGTKPTVHRLYSFPLSLKPMETSSFQLKLKKEAGKPLVTTAYLKSENVFNRRSFVQQILIGSYYGISLLSVLFSLLIFYFLRKSTYLIYATYIIFLGLFISSYIGVFSQIFLPENTKINKYTHYVLFSEISLVLFALFSQKILEAQTYMPRLKRTIEILLTILILLRLSLHFFFNQIFENAVSFFMNIWYGIFLILIILIIIEIAVFFKRNNKRTSLFALAYAFMIFGTFASILYHSYGLVNTYFYDLPLLFYSSFLEILFLTFTIVFMVKDIYDERNLLSKKIVIQEKKNLTAFIKGEDQERRRISKELHDNIGSQLSYLKRFVSDTFKNEQIAQTIDTICNDVRNLSHDISPSDLNIIGFENAVKDLASNISKQTSIQVDFNSYHCPETLNHDSSTQLYRVIQEAFSNILKHADANHIEIQLVGHDNALVINIEDNGKGFNPITKEAGIGLKNMNSRMEQIGGSLTIDSRINQGTSILISLPLP
ncbi:7TM diverse intracellular signaling domain-containing protein [Cognatitamlana onchidii]|uniref:7TM diverse intracellular signaling domain-containing protein n=1 Tax=Cognatitamlana onchidii TaxID=2562860 RepID=UPI0010A5E20C|nr:7TM diverse intracellular signaling domain-containing protein [Algibacter onchidii]